MMRIIDKAKLFPCPPEHFWKDTTGEHHHDMPGCPGYDTAAYDAAVLGLVHALELRASRINGIFGYDLVGEYLAPFKEKP